MSKYRDLLKEATALKRAKKFDEACEKLREAYSHRNGEYWTIAEALRLPAYLQLAGRKDDALKEFHSLLHENKYISQPKHPLNESVDNGGTLSLGVKFSMNTGNLAVIHAEISKFYGRECSFKNQLLHHCMSYVFEVVSKIEIIQSMYDMADDYPKKINEIIGENKELRDLHLKIEESRNKESPPHVYTANGNPVRDVAYPHLKDFVLQKSKLSVIKENVKFLSEKSQLSSQDIDKLSNKIRCSIDKADLFSDDWKCWIMEIIEIK